MILNKTSKNKVKKIVILTIDNDSSIQLRVNRYQLSSLRLAEIHNDQHNPSKSRSWHIFIKSQSSKHSSEAISNPNKNIIQYSIFPIFKQYSQMQYRNYLRPDPFLASKQYISSRLQILQHTILSRFKAGAQRQIMRVTINQLLNTESTLEGKINRLSTLIEQMDVCGQYYEDTAQSQAQIIRQHSQHRFIPQIRDIASQYSAKKYDKYSNLQESYDYRTPPDHYQSIKQFSRNQVPYAHSSVNNRQSLQNNQLSSLRSSKSSNNLSTGNYLNPKESINQNDLFSFRTQQATSPLKRSKEMFEKKHSYKQQNPYDYLYQKERSKSHSLKDSSKSRKSKSLSKSKESKQKPKQTNFDGKGIVFTPRRLAQNKKSPSKHKQTIKQSQIFKKIQKRIACSKCVVESIQHSKSSTNDSYITNRYRQQKQLRGQVINQFKQLINSHSLWR